MRYLSKLVASIGLAAALLCGPSPIEPRALASSPAKNNYNRSLAGANTTGYIIDLGNSDGSPGTYDRFTQLTISVNGSSGDYWVWPVAIDDGVGAGNVPISAVPSGGQDIGFIQIKSGESRSFGVASSKGYDALTFGHRFYTHVYVWCQAAGTVSATQLQIIGS